MLEIFFFLKSHCNQQLLTFTLFAVKWYQFVTVIQEFTVGQCVTLLI